MAVMDPEGPLRLLFTGLVFFGLWSHAYLSEKTANQRSGLGYNKTTRQNSEQCRERVEQNSYKVVQMLLFVVENRSISRTCRADIVLMSPKLVDKLVPGSASFYTTTSDENWRHTSIHDAYISLRHLPDMRTR